MSHEYDHHAFGLRLRHIRMAFGFTEKEAATMYGVTVQTYKRYEAGQPMRGVQKGVDAARHLDVDLGWFFNGKGCPPSGPTRH